MFLDLLAERQPCASSSGAPAAEPAATAVAAGGGSGAAAAPPEEWRIYFAFKGELPTAEELAGFRGIVITGSV